MRFYDMKHHYGRIPSHRASQRLSIGSFCMKLRALPYGGICVRFYDMKHHYGRIPSHRASQKLSIGSFGRKLCGSPYEGNGMPKPAFWRLWRRLCVSLASIMRYACVWCRLASCSGRPRQNGVLRKHPLPMWRPCRFTWTHLPQFRCPRGRWDGTKPGYETGIPFGPSAGKGFENGFRASVLRPEALKRYQFDDF